MMKKCFLAFVSILEFFYVFSPLLAPSDFVFRSGGFSGEKEQAGIICNHFSSMRNSLISQFVSQRKSERECFSSEDRAVCSGREEDLLQERLDDLNRQELSALLDLSTQGKVPEDRRNKALDMISELLRDGVCAFLNNVAARDVALENDHNFENPSLDINSDFSSFLSETVEFAVEKVNIFLFTVFGGCERNLSSAKQTCENYQDYLKGDSKEAFQNLVCKSFESCTNRIQGCCVQAIKDGIKVVTKNARESLDCFAGDIQEHFFDFTVVQQEVVLVVSDSLGCTCKGSVAFERVNKEVYSCLGVVQQAAKEKLEDCMQNINCIVTRCVDNCIETVVDGCGNCVQDAFRQTIKDLLARICEGGCLDFQELVKQAVLSSLGLIHRDCLVVVQDASRQHIHECLRDIQKEVESCFIQVVEGAKEVVAKSTKKLSTEMENFVFSEDFEAQIEAQIYDCFGKIKERYLECHFPQEAEAIANALNQGFSDGFAFIKNIRFGFDVCGICNEIVDNFAYNKDQARKIKKALGFISGALGTGGAIFSIVSSLVLHAIEVREGVMPFIERGRRVQNLNRKQQACSDMETLEESILQLRQFLQQSRGESLRH